jgi:hypothetical protein
MLILGIVFLIISDHFDIDIMDTFGGIFTIFGFLSLVIALVTIILSHGMTDKMIQQNKLEYDGLCKRYEIIKSEYEDISKSDVIADITEWNKEVYNTKYWTKSLWTNWFNPNAIADDLKYISLEGK